MTPTHTPEANMIYTHDFKSVRKVARVSRRLPKNKAAVVAHGARLQTPSSPGKPTPKGSSWEEEFDKRVNELRNSDYESEKPVDFGYRFLDDDEDELHTATDWGRVKSFISTQIAAAKKERDQEWIRKAEEINEDICCPMCGGLGIKKLIIQMTK